MYVPFTRIEEGGKTRLCPGLFKYSS